MTKRLLISLALAAAISFGVARLHAQGSETHVPCGSASAQQFCIDPGLRATCGGIATAAGAVSCAVGKLEEAMVYVSGASCGPCEIFEACKGSVTNLTAPIHVGGPWEMQDGTWAARAWFEGCYNVSCSLCDA